MLKNSQLLLNNSNLELSNGLFMDSQSAVFRESFLNSRVISKAKQVLSNATTKALFSRDLELAANADANLNLLNSTPYQFVHAFDLKKVNNVLDLTQDCGGVAHFLADQVGSVDAIKIDSGVAELSALRCLGQPNVTHVCEDIGKLNLPDVYYDLILLTKLEDLQQSSSELSSLLVKLRNSLTPSGCLVIGVANSQRLSKTINPGQHEIPYLDSYQASNTAGKVCELDRRTLRNAVLNQSFSRVDVHASFSPDGGCSNLFSENYLTSNVHALNHFHQLGYIDNPSVCEYLYFKRLVAEKQDLVDYASRFLVFAGVTPEAVSNIYSSDFSYFSDTKTKPENRVRTERQRASSGVQKLALNANHQGHTVSIHGTLTQNLEPVAFHKGPLLVDRWLTALLNDDDLCLEQAGIGHVIAEYQQWLTGYIKTLTTEGRLINYQLQPHNIIVHSRSQEYLPINKEWSAIELPDGFLLFRALFWFAHTNRTLFGPYFKKHSLYCIGDFIIKHHPHVQRIDELKAFCVLEHQLQSEIFQDSSVINVYEELIQSSLKPSDTESQLVLSASWNDQESTNVAEGTVGGNAYACWKQSSSTQTLTLDVTRTARSGTQLKIRPADQVGTVKITELALYGENGHIMWNTGSKKIEEAENEVGITQHNELITISCPESGLLFDLSALENLESVKELSITISWLWGQDYSHVLKSLSHSVTLAHQELSVQGRRLQDYQSRVESRDLRISDLRQHRDDLLLMVKKIEKRIDIERNVQGNLYAQIEHLEGRLHAQHIRNDELHSFLLARPSSRLKRLTSRWLNRLKGNTEVSETQIPIAQAPDKLVEKLPFDKLPEGEMVAMNTEDYELWIQENTLTETQIEQAKMEIENMAYKPVFSILVPIYNTDPEYLLPMIKSVQNQIYPHWQLCLVDDSSPKTYLKRILEQEAIEDDRISIQLNDVNQGISVTTNDALAIATGDYIALLDHDDEITIDALYENAKLINHSPQVGLIYSDEDKMELDGTRIEPYFKPDYSPDLLDTNNYICHFTVIKKEVIEQIGGFREGLDGSQDHDVILRAVEAAKEVAHIPRILYHWRKIPGSTAVEYDSKGYAWEAGRKAIEDLHRKHEDGVRVELGALKGSYRIVREVIGNPLVSIVIPFKDKPALLDSCLKSILERTSYSNFEIIGVSNNSEEAQTRERMAYFSDSDSRIRFVEHNVPFNFSEICNFGVSHTNGDYVVLLNNDVEIITPDWIENMLQHAQRNSVGAVGCKLLFPDGRIQHAGIVAGMVGAAGHPHKLFPESHIGYHGRLHMVSNVSAVTGAMMMMSKKKFDEVGGLDAKNLAVAYNDVDFCLKLIDKGYVNVFTPYAKAIHHESVSRGYEDTDEKMQRLLKEQRHFLERWNDFLEKGDPFYNPNMSLKNERFSLNFKD